MAKAKSKLKFPDRKISETFLQFAEPLLDAVGPHGAETQMQQPLMIAWTVWNAVVYADAGANGRMLDDVLESMGHDPQLTSFAETLIDRKRTVGVG